MHEIAGGVGVEVGRAVLRRSPVYRHAITPIPVESLGALIACFPSTSAVPRISRRSASELPFSRPAQRSLHVIVCPLTKSFDDPLHPLRYLYDRSGCDRLER
jgi:hypothetical protein